MGMLWVLLIGSSIGGFSPPMIADITEDIKTEFGTYHPYLVEVTPSCSLYTIQPGFTNVVNFEEFSFSPKEESLLFENGFVACPSSYMEMYDIYNECKEKEIPIFITGDAMLHTFHLLYDKVLVTCEMERFMKDIENLTDILILKSEEEYESAKDEKVKEAARCNVAYFCVAKELLDPTFSPPYYVTNLVEDEIELIEWHQGFSPSPIFGYREDYSQYLPRGHYTKSEELRRYFLAMMWYGRMTFIIKSQPEMTFVIEDGPDTLIERLTRMAILITQLMNNTSINGEPALTVWERVYLPTVFFVGRTDDINLYQYTRIAKEVYGDDFSSLSIEVFGDDSLLNLFLQKARELPDPKIWTPTPKGFRFMGQRFIPDSYIFTELTCDRIPGARALPKGLDVMAVLGSDRAYEILDKVYNETRYAGYKEKLESLKREFAALPDATWAENLYYNWLYCLMPLLFEKGEGFPFFMRHQAWLDKELDEALGSWTELRHDTILYAKQSYTVGVSPDYKKYGYVEPNPWLFARLASLGRYMREGLDNLGLLSSDFKKRFKAFESLQLKLKEMAEKELENQKLSDSEYKFITYIGQFLQSLVNFDEEYRGTSGFPSHSEDQLPVIADVHTDPVFTNTCLEEGTGYPLCLYVIVDIGGELILTKGAAFLYFEFAQPFSHRLTDEEWQEMLKTDPPDLPVWLGSFLDISQDFTIPSPHHYGAENSDYTGVEEIETLPHSSILLVNPNPMKKEVSIKYFLKSPGWVRIEVYDLSGRLIDRLLDSYKNQGWHTVIWESRVLPSGVYFVRLHTKNIQATEKMVVM